MWASTGSVHSGSCKTAQHHGGITGVMAYGVVSDRTLVVIVPVTIVAPLDQLSVIVAR